MLSHIIGKLNIFQFSLQIPQKIIIVTGQIASGKTTFAKILEQKYNYINIDTDQITQELLKPNNKLYTEYIKLFRQQIVQQDGTLNRKLIGQITFDDKEKTKQLNQVAHKVIYQEMMQQIEQNKNSERNIELQIPLYYESNMKLNYKVINVCCHDRQKQIERIIHRSGQAQINRLNQQMSNEERNKLADYCVWNDGTLQDLENEADRINNLIQQQ